jgi:hypothetical protein
MDIAVELFLTGKMALAYSDIMGEQEAGHASARALTEYLNDRSMKGAVCREGIITQYLNNHTSHFEGNYWQGRHLKDFIEFVADMLIDRAFTKKNAEMFLLSLKSRKWFEAFVSIAGQKLMERLYCMSAIKSPTAVNRIQLNMYGRELESKVISCGRHAGGIDAQTGDVIANAIKESFAELVAMAPSKEEFKAIMSFDTDIKDVLKSGHERILMLA